MATTLTGKKRKASTSLDLPPGFDFNPTDAQLLGYYLFKKLQGEEEDFPDGYIHDANIYEFHPEELGRCYAPALSPISAARRTITDWYFFTPRERMHANGKRPSRKAGTAGFWKATGSFPVVTDLHGNKLGNKRALVFHEGVPKKSTKTHWLMHEYVIEHFDSWVLCRIRYRGKLPASILMPATPATSSTVDCMTTTTTTTPATRSTVNCMTTTTMTTPTPDHVDHQYDHALQWPLVPAFLDSQDRESEIYSELSDLLSPSILTQPTPSALPSWVDSEQTSAAAELLPENSEQITSAAAELLPEMDVEVPYLINSPDHSAAPDDQSWL